MLVNRLRVRLMASYLVVLLVTLAVISVLVVLLLRARPVPVEPIVQRLVTIARTVERVGSGALGGRLLNPNRPELIARALDELSSRQTVRALLVGPEGVVIYDSLGVFEAGGVVDLQREGVLPPAPLSGSAEPLFQGRFTQGDGDVWLFVGQILPQPWNGAVLLLAAPRPQSSWGEVLNTFGASLLGPLIEAGLVGLGIAAALAWLTSRGLVRHLQRLRDAAHAVAAGDYRQRVPVQGPDEIRDVATAFNNMAAQVQATQAAQQDFLANVSHDLRTPLTSIQGFSQAIIDGASKDPAHHARIIHDEAGRLNRLVNELLDLARLSSGRLSMRHERVNLALIADNVAERLAIKAAEGGVRLVRDIQDAPDIAGDGDRLAQVLTNLLDNALKFTPSGGAVGVMVGPAAGGVQVTISDTGQGIPPEDLPRIFERFYQADKARGPRRGTGLGLAIAAEIVQAHGGRIRADSGGEGRGATFTLWFPALGASTVARRAR